MSIPTNYPDWIGTLTNHLIILFPMVLKTKSELKHRIYLKGIGLSKQDLRVGNLINKIIGVEFFNNHPYYQAMLWSGIYVSDSDIRYIENKFTEK